MSKEPSKQWSDNSLRRFLRRVLRRHGGSPNKRSTLEIERGSWAMKMSALRFPSLSRRQEKPTPDIRFEPITKSRRVVVAQSSPTPSSTKVNMVTKRDTSSGRVAQSKMSTRRPSELRAASKSPPLGWRSDSKRKASNVFEPQLERTNSKTSSSVIGARSPRGGSSPVPAGASREDSIVQAAASTPIST